MTVRIITADVLAGLAQLPDDSVHCVVTSPPYWGLRDYGTGQWEGGDADCEHADHRYEGTRTSNSPKQQTNAGSAAIAYASDCLKCGARRIDNQIGLEPTLAEHIERLVGVFEQVRRVLRPDGVCFLNYGDAYAAQGGGKEAGQYEGKRVSAADWQAPRKPPAGLKPKDLCLIPHRLAIALQDSGWWVRSDIIWAKSNPMPESVTDRPTNSHEHVFLLTKNGADPTFWTHARGKGGSRTRPEPDHIWTHKATGEERTERPVEYDDDPTNWTRRNLWRGSAYWWDAEAVREEIKQGNSGNIRVVEREEGTAFDETGKPKQSKRNYNVIKGANLRNVWTIATHSFPDAHFATFAPKLVETCLKAGCPEKVCADCGAPYVREVERVATQPGVTGGATPYDADRPDGMTLRAGGFGGGSSKTLGFSPSCDCQQTYPIPAGTCLDPFGGSGTTGLVADRMKRNAVLIELSPEYAEMARRRIEGDAGLFAQVDLQAEATA